MRVVLLPGMDGTGLLFEPLLRELSGDFDVQIISYPPDGEQSYTELTEYVKDKLPEYEDFLLVAESFSGPIGYAIAATPPDNLKAVIFVATFVSPPNTFLAIASRLPLALIFKMPLPRLAIKYMLLGKDAPNYLVHLFDKSLKMVKPHALAYRVKAMAKLKGGLKPIQVPCAYIIPTNDRLVSRCHIETFKNLAPAIDLIKIAGSHFIMQIKPLECAKVIRKYAAV